ncbi:MAG: sugar ABC transporter ATP-binding protein [Bacillota bacterium]
MAEKTPILSIRNLQKTFGTKTVVDDLSFDVYPGEVIALVGENGAGKSTTKNMLCGLLEPTAGKIIVDGKEFSKINGYEHGISAVHQELSLFQSLSVAANICISQLPGHSARINWKEVDVIAKQQLDFLGADIEPSAIVKNLGMGKQQMVEISKALLYSDRLLILDEPTTSLTVPEREKLFAIMERLKERGVAILFISHFMDEIFRASDKYLCLRDGKQVGFGNIADVEQHELETMMVGRTISELAIDIGTPTEEEVLKVEKLSSYDFDDVSFTAHKGEILGLQGLVGAGRTEVVESIFGIRKSEGTITMHGNVMNPPMIRKMMEAGMCLVTEDRRANGLFGIRSVRENITAAGIHKFVERKIKGFGFKKESENADVVSKDMNVALPHIEAKIASLSGGNQQKVIIGRWLSMQPNVIILDEPTKGVDIGAKFEIHSKIAALAKEGNTVILVSSDLPELLSLSHRIMVMRAGHLVGELQRDEFDSVKIISMAASSSMAQE